MNFICEKILSLLVLSLLFFSCSGNEKGSAGTEITTDTIKTNSESSCLNRIYASVDSTFVVDMKKFRVHIDQVDMTDKAWAEGDTSDRPTYLCAMQIFNETGEVLYEDSLARDSWGYPGKIEAINAYQIALPELFFEKGEIIASYRIYELNSMDAILGSVAFDVTTHQTRMYWNETYLE